MDIPRHWERASGEARMPDGRILPLNTWGWGDSASAARKRATQRLHQALERLRRGEAFARNDYAYGRLPLREEILQLIDGATPTEASAVITRNAYGVAVLNTARLLFLDIDLPRPGLAARLRRLFRRGDGHELQVLDRLRETLQQYRRTSFRIYRTASGYRVIAVDREFDPAGDEAQQLMQSTATDPAFARLCRVQNSFRARLTPKPWRCKMRPPPGRFPRHDVEMQQRFAQWLQDYQRASAAFATCRLLDTVGHARPSRALQPLIERHDQQTRCDSALPLA